MKTIKFISIVVLSLLCIPIGYFFIHDNINMSEKKESILTQKASRRSFPIEIHSIGELDAMRSTSISSALRGDLGKIIYLVSDGASVKTDDVLVKLDPTPFEEQIVELRQKIKEQEGHIESFERFLKWETYQVEHEIRAAEIEVEASNLEINKLTLGDGPLEEAHLKAAMQKSLSTYQELKGYIDDFMSLQDREFLSPVEVKLAQKKLQEEADAYEEAKMAYENFILHTHPMQIKKAQTVLKRSQNKYEEMIKSGGFKIAKAQIQLDQAKQELSDLQIQLKNAEYQMSLSVIRAPTPGMVVLREDYRNGQRRKPRIGDVVVKNQSILDLPYLEKMLVKTKVREIDLFKIAIGTPASVTVDAYPELTLEGKIHSIGVLAFSDLTKTGDEKYFEVIIKLESSDQRLRPGMTTRILFHAKRIENQITIPIQTVFEFHKQNYCFIKHNHQYSAIPIEIGSCSDHWVEVKSGLNENDDILLSMPPRTALTNPEQISEDLE